MDKQIMEAFQKVAKMLEALGQKYNIPMQELEPIAKACGSAIAGQNMQGSATQAVPEAQMEAGQDDELSNALGGR